MKFHSRSAWLRSWPFPWPALLAGILIVKAILSLTLRQSFGAARYNADVYFLLLLLATAFAVRNAVQNIQGNRPFWVFLAVGTGLWSLDQVLYLYYVNGLHRDVPDSSIADPALFLHIVPLMAAVAIRPYVSRFHPKAGRATLNFLVLLFFWVFLYAYVLFPYQYLFWNPAIYNPRFDVLYLVENVALVVVLGIAAWHASAPWRSICIHLLGASALYALGSTLGNLLIDAGGYYNGSLYSFFQAASACWFVWVPLRARQLAPARLQPSQPDGHMEYTSLLAVLAVVAIPLIGVWEVFRRDEPPGMRAFRLAVVLVSVLFLAVAAFLKEYLAKRELATDAHFSQLQKKFAELALEASEVVKGSILSSSEHQIAARLIDAQEQERRRIARDLHDDISQRLGLLTMELDRLRKTISDPSAKVLSRIGELRKQTVEITADIRALAYELHSPKLEHLGLVAATEGFCKEFSEQQQVEIVFKNHDLPSSLSRNTSLCLFRVLQEALRNAAKHSEAQYVEVQLWGTAAEVHLTVSDSGVGFDPELAKQGRGLGLISMQERLSLVNGTIAIRSEPNTGTVLSVRVPIELELSDAESDSAAG
jgi:signal transduction histidine kinase